MRGNRVIAFLVLALGMIAAPATAQMIVSPAGVNISGTYTTNCIPYADTVNSLKCSPATSDGANVSLPSGALIVGSTPASTGTIRLPNAFLIKARNVANNADVTFGEIRADDKIYLDPAGGGIVTGSNNTPGGLSVGNGTSGMRWDAASGGSILVSSVDVARASSLPSLDVRSDFILRWNSTAVVIGTPDAGVARPSAGLVEVNNGTAGTLADFRAGTVQAGATSATVGYVRVPNNGDIAARNAANSANVSLISADASNRVLVAAANSTGVQLGGAALTLTAGAIGMNKMTASATAPGAAGAKFEVVCGTNAGTAKLIMAAGTSGTAVTVVDNVGAGVTGCP